MGGGGEEVGGGEKGGNLRASKASKNGASLIPDPIKSEFLGVRLICKEGGFRERRGIKWGGGAAK